jgi:hypothetical protein
MTYIRVEWKQSNLSYPILLYSELNGDRWEVRKVEVFFDGRRGFANASESAGGTGLSKEPIPPLSEIAADPQFEPSEISQGEFERVWAEREK